MAPNGADPGSSECYQLVAAYDTLNATLHILKSRTPTSLTLKVTHEPGQYREFFPTTPIWTMVETLLIY